MKSFASNDGRNKVAPEMGTIVPGNDDNNEFSMEDASGFKMKPNVGIEMSSTRNYDTSARLNVPADN